MAFASRMMATLGFLFARVGLAISQDEADAASAPTLTAGSGAPNSTDEPAGSRYFRTNGAEYRYVSSAWEQMPGGLTSTVDYAVTVTAADELLNVDLSVNHATAQGVAVDASAVQLTTARTSGTLAAVAGKTTSLAGDSGGTYADFWARAPTDGGGSAVHVALLVGAGHDALIDASGAASGEADIIVGDNLAVALQVREAANAYITCVSTNSAERVTLGKLLALGAGVNPETLAGNKTLTFADAHFQRLDPGGAGRDVTLPALTAGLFFRILNTADAAEDLTVKAPDTSTVVTISQNEAAWVVCDGTNWLHMGIETIALA